MSPDSAEAERAVVGGVLVEPDAWSSVAHIVAPKHLDDPRHRLIWTAISGLIERGDGVDTISVKNALATTGDLGAAGGAAYLTDLVSGVPRTLNLEDWGRIVRDRDKRRRFLAIWPGLRAKADSGTAVEELINQAQAELLHLAAPGDGGHFDPEDVARAGEVLINETATATGGLVGIPSGLASLDKRAGGWRPGQYIVIGARPSCGKSALGAQMGIAAARAGHTVQFFSLEMTAQEIAMRSICQDAGVEIGRLRGAGQDQALWQDISLAWGRQSKLPFYVEELTRPTVAQIHARSMRLQARRGLGLVVIDYLQYLALNPRAETMNVAVGANSQGLKAVARQLGVPVIVLAQLNRRVEHREDKRPTLADLRDSGSIEADADIGLLIWRKGLDSSDPSCRGETELLLEKNRNGPRGSIPVWFDAGLVQFREAGGNGPR